MQWIFSGSLNINGQSDPTPLHSLLEWREYRRDGVAILDLLQTKYPAPWQGNAHWLSLASSGRTVVAARQAGEPALTESQQLNWNDLCKHAANTMQALSAGLSTYGVLELAIRRDRLDISITRRGPDDEDRLAKETYFILKKYVGGDFEAEQALLRLPTHCRHHAMTDATTLDVCLVQAQSGHFQLLCADQGTAWSRRVDNLLDAVHEGFDEADFSHIPEIRADPHMRHLSVNVSE